MNGWYRIEFLSYIYAAAGSAKQSESKAREDLDAARFNKLVADRDLETLALTEKERSETRSVRVESEQQIRELQKRIEKAVRAQETPVEVQVEGTGWMEVIDGQCISIRDDNDQPITPVHYRVIGELVASRV